MYSGFADELFPASGAGNGNFAFASGDPDHLAALGTVEIAVVPILNAAHKLQEFPILLVALVGIPGQKPEDGPEHEPVAQEKENQVQQDAVLHEHGNEAGSQAHAQNHHVQLVVSIAARHEMRHAHLQFLHPSDSTIHCFHLANVIFNPIILHNSNNATWAGENLRIV